MDLSINFKFFFLLLKFILKSIPNKKKMFFTLNNSTCKRPKPKTKPLGFFGWICLPSYQYNFLGDFFIFFRDSYLCFINFSPMITVRDSQSAFSNTCHACYTTHSMFCKLFKYFILVLALVQF